MHFGRMAEMELHYQLGAEVEVVRFDRAGETVRVAIADRAYDAQVNHVRSDEITFTVNGLRHTAHVASNGSTRYVFVDGEVFELKRSDSRRRERRKHHRGEDSLTAAMPGQITRVLVGEGDEVQRGQPLIVLEAMKMEIKITAPQAGRVAKVLVRPGQVVDRGQEVIELSDIH